MIDLSLSRSVPFKILPGVAPVESRFFGTPRPVISAAAWHAACIFPVNLVPRPRAAHSLSMRLFFFVLLLLLPGLAVPVRAGRLDVVRVWPGYRTAASFERIGDFFDGGENPSGETIRRSRPAAREGFYFLVRLKNPGPAVAGATFELQVVTPATPEPVTFAFQADVPAGTRAFDLGLTGADWPGPKTGAVAWQLTVRAPDGSELARRQSFLWARPGAAP